MASQDPNRVLLKLSGESLSGAGARGIDTERARWIAGEIAQSRRGDGSMAIVVGGGNIVRGAKLAQEGLVEQATADQMGMLGTLINGLALASALREAGVDAVCLSAVEGGNIAETYSIRSAREHLASGRVIVLSGGVGHPFFTTDSGAALRAAELGCARVLKATKVDGVYSADPNADPSAERYERLTFDEALERRLGVMDQAALALCRENGIELLVFDFQQPGAIARAAAGAVGVGTIVVSA